MNTIDVSSRRARAIFYSSVDWKKIRQDRLDLDNNECQWHKAEGKTLAAGMHDEHGNLVVLEVDHIKELAEYPELALDIDNLRTLCKDCHNKRHKRFNYKPSKKKRKWDDEWW
ncbi:HNH endonuclease [Carnobacterium divergens]|uniref:HNH endonuclease signature motif containing protein n=1 Tax=Carnobacterium divergens TaxID=2748 RepID=UPI0010732502|nr:HNH endonuclease signature motif containing protein [Carnobacterium divergens]TFI93091.1 HNH endonuclease [Carnobacterium divergens]